MKKKILVLIGLVILTTGCNATINVNIDKDNVNQKYIINMDSSELSNGTVYKTKNIDDLNENDYIMLPSYEEITTSKRKYAESFQKQNI